MKFQLSFFVALSLLLGHNVDAAHPKVIMTAGREEPVENSFIVVLKTNVANDRSYDSSVQARADSLASDKPNIIVSAIFEKAIQGFVAQMTTEEAEGMAESDDIAYIEQDVRVQVSDIVETSSRVTSWGLDRVDQRELPLDNSYSPFGHGEGVTAYIIDSGIRTTHEEFEDRATWAVNFMGDGKDYDCHGHGTHVAGTVAGKTVGVANKAKVVAVKVLGCDNTGWVSGFIQGVEWVMNNAQMPATANMSIGTYVVSPSLNTAANKLHNSGIPMVVSAGNDYGDACNHSPSSATDVITVGSTTITDARSSFSNGGVCVKIMAPGDTIKSALSGSDTEYGEWSGTSMAAPHVCGGVALLLEAGVPAADVRAELESMATPGKISDLQPGTPDLLLFIDGQGPQAPSAKSPKSPKSPKATKALKAPKVPKKMKGPKSNKASKSYKAPKKSSKASRSNQALRRPRHLNFPRF